MKLAELFERKRFILLDGAMGTQLTERGLRTGQKPELARFFLMPETLESIHRDYAKAGADILLANTFGADPKKLAGTGYTTQQVISASIACARRAAAETGALVALDIGTSRGNSWHLQELSSLRMPVLSLPTWCGPEWWQGLI